MEEPEAEAGGAPGDPAPPVVYDALRESGARLDPGIQRLMESHLGADFSSVRIHTSTLAQRAAAAVDARAYTVGRDVVFGAPGFDAGDQRSVNTLAHELTHTVQSGGAPWSGEQLELDHPDTEAEHEARDVGATVAREIDRPPDESPAIDSHGDAPFRVMRQPVAAPAAPAAVVENPATPTPAVPTSETGPVAAATTVRSAVDPAPAAAQGAAATGGGSVEPPSSNALGSEHATVRAVNQLAVRLAGSRGRSSAGLGAPGQGPAAIRARRLSQAMAADVRAIEEPSDEDLAQLERQLIDAFQVEAMKVAHDLLARNEQIARREATRYGEISSGDPATPANRLRTAARAMAELQQAIIARVQAHGEQVAAGAQAGGFGAPVGRITADQFDDVLEGSYARSEPVVQSQLLPRLQVLKRIYGPEFPILLQRNLDYGAIANADPATLAGIVARSTSQVLRDIQELRKHLEDDPKGIWSLPAVVDATKLRMGIPLNASTPAGAAIDRHRAGLEQNAELFHLGLAALGVAIAVAAIALSAGGATPVAGGVAASVASAGLATASAALSVYGAVEAYSKYEFESAAAGSSLDPASALARDQPGLLWLGAAVVFAVADLGAAGLAFHNLASAWRVAQALNDLRVLEEAAWAEARVLNAEGRLGKMSEEEFVRSVMDPARKRLGGAAARALRHGALEFARNPEGPRSVDAAVALARERGVPVRDDVLIRVVDDLPDKDAFARYGTFQRRLATDRIGWNDLFEEVRPPRAGRAAPYWTEYEVEEPTRLIRIEIRRDVLESDEAIVAVLSHEMHELNNLERIFAERGTMTGADLDRLVNESYGTLHLEAWRVAESAVGGMRAAAKVR